MSEIKSKKALEYVEKKFTSEYNDIEHYLAYYGEDGVVLEKGRIGRCRRFADKAVSIAETELTEHYEQQMQKLIDRAMEVFKEFIHYYKGLPATSSQAKEVIHLFTEKLTEK